MSFVRQAVVAAVAVAALYMLVLAVAFAVAGGDLQVTVTTWVAIVGGSGVAGLVAWYARHGPRQ